MIFLLLFFFGDESLASCHMVLNPKEGYLPSDNITAKYFETNHHKSNDSLWSTLHWEDNLLYQ